MKISNNHVNLNADEIVKQSAASQAQVLKQAKRPEKAKGEANKPVSEAKEEPALSEKQLIEAIEKTNKAIEGTSCSFRYSVHDVTKQIMVKVIDNETQEVIQEIPPEKILDMVAKMWEVAGILVDERR
jgi:flagellar protein FlaG